MIFFRVFLKQPSSLPGRMRDLPQHSWCRRWGCCWKLQEGAHGDMVLHLKSLAAEMELQRCLFSSFPFGFVREDAFTDSCGQSLLQDRANRIEVWQPYWLCPRLEHISAPEFLMNLCRIELCWLGRFEAPCPGYSQPRTPQRLRGFS